MVYNKWTMKHSSGKCTSSSEVLLQAKELEANFLASLSLKGVLDSSVRKLCDNIRDLYESIILADQAFAEVHNVEHSLWLLHYRQIEDFRRLVSSDKECVAARDNQAGSFSKEKWRDLVHSKPALVGFKSFLVEASGFYHELILKLRVQRGLSLDLWDGTFFHENKTVELKRCRQSCYRCLVNLGDYARYKEFYVGNDSANYDFSIAADFYRKALAHWPMGGQPHNQIAVLAVHVEDELLAVYHYFRSLAAQRPFPTTRENLTMLFDKNRVKYEELVPAPLKMALPGSKPDSRKALEGMKSSRVPKSSRRSPSKKTWIELISCFNVRFVRLNGLFFTKTSLEKFEEVFGGALHDLEQVLALPDRELELALGSGNHFGMAPELHGAFGALKLVSVLICTVENIPRSTGVTRRDVLFQNASTALLGIMGPLMQRCAEAHDTSTSPLLPAMLVFSEWVACRPQIIQGFDEADEQFKLLSFIWKQFRRLLIKFSDDKKNKDTMHDSQKDFKVNVALWEDFELQGFSPMVSAHATVSYGERPKGYAMDILKDQQIRIQRLMATWNSLALMAEANNKGMLLSQSVEKLHILEGGKPLNKSRDTSENKIGRLAGAAVQAKGSEAHLQHRKEACRDDEEEDEEVIVFQPASKEKLIMTSGGHGTAALCDSASNSEKPKLPCALGLTAVPVSSSLEVIKTSSAPISTCVPNFYDAYSPRLESCSALETNLTATSSLSEELRNLASTGGQIKQTDMSTSYNQATRPLFAHPSSNHIMIPSTYINGVACNPLLGSRKAANSLGVIGEPKQLRSSKDSDKIRKNDHDVSQNGALPFNVKSFSQPLSLSSCEQLSKGGDVQAGVASKFVNLGPGSTSALTKQSSSLFTGEVMRPPPGFGPKPTNSGMSYTMGNMSLQQGVREQLKLGNDCLSDYFKTWESNMDNLRGPPGYNLWSTVNSKMVQSGGGTGLPPLSAPLSHPGNPAAALLPRTNEKETWSLFASPAAWTQTIFS